MQAKRPDKVITRSEAYLTTTAVSLLRDRAKVAARRSTASHLPAEEVALVGSDNIAALEARDQLERLQASLARLSPKSRLVFLAHRSEEHTSELQSLMRISYAVFCLKKKNYHYDLKRPIQILFRVYQPTSNL